MSFVCAKGQLETLRRDRAILLAIGFLIVVAAFLFPFESLLKLFWTNSDPNQVGHWKRYALLKNAHWLILGIGFLIVITAIFFARIVQILQSSINVIEAVEEKKWLWTILFLAVLARAIWMVSLPNQPVSDASVFNSLGWRLASGKGYYIFLNDHAQAIPSAFWPIGYPLFLSVLYSIFGHSLLAAKMANLLFGVLTIVLVYFLSRELFNPLVAKLASALLTFWPNQIALTNITATEPIFTFILVLLVTLVILPRRQLTKLQLVGTGCIMGYGALVKPVLLPFGAVIFLILAKKGNSLRKAILHSLLIIILMGATIIPWAIRNYITFGRVIPISTNMGFNLWAGNNPEASGTYMIPEQLAVNPFQTSLRENEIEFGKRGVDLATKYILAHPFRFLTMGLKKMFFLYSRDNSAINWSFAGVKYQGSRRINLVVNIVNQGYYITVLMLFILYIIKELKNISNPLRLENSGLLIVLYFSAIYFVFFGDDRFHIPFIPFVAMYASVTLEILLNRYRVLQPQSTQIWEA